MVVYCCTVFCRVICCSPPPEFDADTALPILPLPILRPVDPPPCPVRLQQADDSAAATTAADRIIFASSSPRTLVIYIFANNDAHYLANLEYFIQHAVRCNQPTDY